MRETLVVGERMMYSIAMSAEAKRKNHFIAFRRFTIPPKILPGGQLESPERVFYYISIAGKRTAIPEVLAVAGIFGIVTAGLALISSLS